MDRAAISGHPELFEVVRDALKAFSDSGHAGVYPIDLPAEIARCRVGAPATMRNRLRDFVAASRPGPGARLSLGVSGHWLGRRVAVIRLTLSSAGDPAIPQPRSLHLPLRLADWHSDKPAGTLPAPPHNRQRRVLVVDDDPVCRRLTTALLQSLDCDTTSVESGEKALELAAAFDVIFMDCEMPRLSGYETTALLRGMESAYTPIIALTASIPAGWQAHQKCLQSGMDDYLPKPVGVIALKRALEWWAPARTR